jgi:hypothetical protein
MALFTFKSVHGMKSLTINSLQLSQHFLHPVLLTSSQVFITPFSHCSTCKSPPTSLYLGWHKSAKILLKMYSSMSVTTMVIIKISDSHF